MAKPEKPTTPDQSIRAKTPGVRLYDFKTVRKLSQAERVHLGAMHSRFAAAFTKQMETFINCEVETSFLGFEQVQGAAFQAADYPDVISANFQLASSKGMIYSIWPREIAFYIIERKLGSSGDQLFTDKPLTDFEKNILIRFGDELFTAFQAGFEKQEPPQGACKKIMEGVEPFAEQMPYEVLLMSRINVQVKNYQGAIIMVYPYSLAKPWMTENETTTGPEEITSWKDSEAGIPSSLGDSPLFMTIKMNETPIKISDFNQLQVGDCIQLNQSINDPFDIYVENQLKFQGYLGSVGRQLATKISSKINGMNDIKEKNAE